ncbi:MAG: hypothetical protein QF723_01150, partial [Phycisphaerales bacterium]|nr:hypothetical protein [Phycisphaerales bacterium]
MKYAVGLVLAVMVAWTTQSFAADITLAPPTDVTVEDVPNDVGTQMLVKWKASLDELNDASGAQALEGYAIFRIVAQT